MIPHMTAEQADCVCMIATEVGCLRLGAGWMDGRKVIFAESAHDPNPTKRWAIDERGGYGLMVGTLPPFPDSVEDGDGDGAVVDGAPGWEEAARHMPLFGSGPESTGLLN